MGGLTFEQWMGELRAIDRCAYHLERQPYYAVELDVYQRWCEGDRSPPVDEPGFAEWYELLCDHTAGGRRVARVRVVEEPPTTYQEFERWCGRWNTAHGEEVRSVPRSVAEHAGLVEPGRRSNDWWLLDEARLMVMPFDADGRLGAPSIVTDRRAVTAALAEWRIAVAHSTADEYDTP